MFKCKICKAILKRGSGHIKPRHNISTLDYVKKYEEIDCCEMYMNGHSAQQISTFIKGRVSGISPIKGDVLKHLKKSGVSIRSTSSATKEWIKKTGGVWNKGLTKEQHPSIMKYAKSREGKNNPYYMGSEHSRSRTRYWEYKTEAELKEIRRRSGETLREKYRSGEITPYCVLNPEWAKKTQEKRVEGYTKWLKDGNKKNFGSQSKSEKEIGLLLEGMNVLHVKQFSPECKYRYDYYIPAKNLIIEYNGTYWHCDPRKYKKEYHNQKKGQSAQEIWNYDQKRIAYANRLGYNVRVIWEEDYRHLTLQEKRKLLDEIVKN